MKKPKIMVLLSGGADSATCLAEAVADVGADNVCCLNSYYGQRLDKEMKCAEALAQHYGVELMNIDLSPVMAFSDCTLLKNSSKAVVHSSYTEQLGTGLISSYVPFRNGVFLSVAAAIAVSKGVNEIWYGAHDDDFAYPDCSDAFVSAMNDAIMEGTGGAVTICAKLKGLTKARIIEKGLALGVPYGKTWSCYEGRDKACGKCGSCIDRRKAFELNGVTDPIEYEEDN